MPTREQRARSFALGAQHQIKSDEKAIRIARPLPGEKAGEAQSRSAAIEYSIALVGGGTKSVTASSVGNCGPDSNTAPPHTPMQPAPPELSEGRAGKGDSPAGEGSEQQPHVLVPRPSADSPAIDDCQRHSSGQATTTTVSIKLSAVRNIGKAKFARNVNHQGRLYSTPAWQQASMLSLAAGANRAAAKSAKQASGALMAFADHSPPAERSKAKEDHSSPPFPRPFLPP